MQLKTIEEKAFSKTHFPTYRIRFERITNRLTNVFKPRELKDYLLLYELAQKKPQEALHRIKDFQDKYPDLPEIYNLLSFIYVKLRKVKKADKLTIENYQKNPDYIFAKINYADLCLRKKNFHEIPIIFNECTQLTELYPNQHTFHYSEVVGFMCLMGLYNLELGQNELAQNYYDFVKLIDPNDPTVVLLFRKLNESSFFPKFKKIYKKITRYRWTQKLKK